MNEEYVPKDIDVSPEEVAKGKSVSSYLEYTKSLNNFTSENYFKKINPNPYKDDKDDW